MDDNTMKFLEVLREVTPNNTETVDNDTIEYTYKEGDTLGQVLLDLGLSNADGSTLWGDDGDVNYYTQQLIEQGALDQRGYIPIGTTIKLRRRGAEQPQQTQQPQQETVTETQTAETVDVSNLPTANRQLNEYRMQTNNTRSQDNYISALRERLGMIQ